MSLSSPCMATLGSSSLGKAEEQATPAAGVRAPPSLPPSLSSFSSSSDSQIPAPLASSTSWLPSAQHTCPETCPLAVPQSQRVRLVLVRSYPGPCCRGERQNEN